MRQLIECISGTRNKYSLILLWKHYVFVYGVLSRNCRGVVHNIHIISKPKVLKSEIQIGWQEFITRGYDLHRTIVSMNALQLYAFTWTKLKRIMLSTSAIHRRLQKIYIIPFTEKKTKRDKVTDYCTQFRHIRISVCKLGLLDWGPGKNEEHQPSPDW